LGTIGLVLFLGRASALPFLSNFFEKIFYNSKIVAIFALNKYEKS